MMTTSEQIEMHEKLKIIFEENAKRNAERANTMHGRGNAELDLENSGRFAKTNNTVIGTTGNPAAQYPMQLTSQWPNQSAVVGVEPPLGIDVNAMDPQGEAFEVRKSLSEVTELLGASSSLAQGGAVARGDQIAPPNPSTLAEASGLPSTAVPLRKHQRDVELASAKPKSRGVL
jgi:hypothetical protein